MKSKPLFPLIIIFCLGLVLLLPSCSKEEKTEPNKKSSSTNTEENAKVGGELSADIDGIAWNGKNIMVELFSQKVSIDGDSNNHKIGIYIREDAQEGITYSVSSSSLSNHLYYFHGTQNYKLIDGEITVDLHDEENRLMEGVFSFDCTDINTQDTVNITNGYFSVKYPKE